MKVIIAPHLDDEVIGCYSVLGSVDHIIYCSVDEARKSRLDEMVREGLVERGRYVDYQTELGNLVTPLQPTDTIYLPSRFDYHPFHRKVRNQFVNLPCRKMFYSVEMNVPWLEEEEDPVGKRQMMQSMWPSEYETLNKSDKYFLFRSIEPFDEIMWATIRFTREGFHCWPDAPVEVGFLRNNHRHLFHIQAQVQQFGDDRDLEYFILSRKAQAWWDTQDWPTSTSCEMFGVALKRWLESAYPDRLVRTSVYEDRENGAVIE